MKLPKLGACAAAVAISIAMPAQAQSGESARESLLQAQIAITWRASIAEFGQLIAQRLALPYQEICPTNAKQLVTVDQDETATVADALRTVNAQLQPAQILELASTPAGLRVELARLGSGPAPASTWGSLGDAQTASPGCDPASAQELATRQSRAVASVAVGSSSTAAAAAVPPRYVLNEGVPVHEELQRWAQAAGWKLIWYPHKSWHVISSSAFANDLDVSGAVEAVVKALRSEGKQILLTVAAANRLMEITSTDITAESNDGNDD